MIDNLRKRPTGTLCYSFSGLKSSLTTSALDPNDPDLDRYNW